MNGIWTVIIRVLHSSKRQSSQVGICWHWRGSEHISYQIWYNSLARAKQSFCVNLQAVVAASSGERKTKFLSVMNSVQADLILRSFFCFLFLLFKTCSEIIFFHFDLLTLRVLTSSIFFGALHILNFIFSVHIYFFLITFLLSSILLIFS